MKLKKMADLYISFCKIGGLTFGGGLAMLPMLQREVVQNHHWCKEEEILDMYAIALSIFQQWYTLWQGFVSSYVH